ncbi:hypothetical protein PJF56_02830 [Roseofilum sp. BLCC_M91]|uniref:FecR protein domain-containing protein n=1 Tax=Roseofilum halophilum BLCC-M91 TaxID=3022259 RepID=A0ABT7BF36_9CYAN|nr:hypothetical protein [Roseofilum halophilum]MDJ1177792.1 hypothetical protein [Roseofilum halophilum BLCC-M91]
MVSSSCLWTQGTSARSAEPPDRTSVTLPPESNVEYNHNLSTTEESLASPVAQAPNGRSVTIEEIKGTVWFNDRPARVGDQLRTPEDRIVTGKDSTARLRIDSQVGVVELAPQTTFQVDILEGGNPPITGFYIPLGRARFSIAPWVSNPERLLGQAEEEITGLKSLDIALDIAQSTETENAPVRVRTPAGVAGVRGTSFGVNVGPDGKTGISTIDGLVGVFSQGQEVLVNPGYYAVINPNEPPTLQEITPALSTLRIRSISPAGNGAVIVAQADPMDIVYVNNREVATDAEGKFRVRVRSGDRVRIVLRGPSVRERHYILNVDVRD